MTPVAKSLLPSQRVPTRKLSQRCGTKTKPGRPNKLVKPWLIGHLRCTVAQQRRQHPALRMSVPDAKRTFNKPRWANCFRSRNSSPRNPSPVAGIIRTQSGSVEMLRWYPVAAVVVAAFGFSISSARSDQYPVLNVPVLNVAPLCHALTDRSSLQLGIRNVSFDDCMKDEQNDRQTMINEWSTFSADDRRHCVSEATMGGESSYTDLLTCLEMARDVRKLHS